MNGADRTRMSIAKLPPPKRMFRRGYQMPRIDTARRAAAAQGSIRRFIITMSVLFPK